jgi:hypothetical protein
MAMTVSFLDRLPTDLRDAMILTGRRARGMFGTADTQSIFDEHLAVFERLYAAGASHLIVSRLLHEAGVRRADGSRLPTGTISSAMSRARMRALAQSAGAVAPAATSMPRPHAAIPCVARHAAADPGATRRRDADRGNALHRAAGDGTAREDGAQGATGSEAAAGGGARKRATAVAAAANSATSPLAAPERVPADPGRRNAAQILNTLRSRPNGETT